MICDFRCAPWIAALLLAPPAAAAEPVVREVKDGLEIETDQLVAKVNSKGYVSGIAAGTFRDKMTGAKEQGFGLHIMDFLLAPGWRDDGYSRDAKVHGNLVEGKVGVLCLAPEEGLGVTNPELREKHLDQITLFRRHHKA